HRTHWMQTGLPRAVVQTAGKGWSTVLPHRGVDDSLVVRKSYHTCGQVELSTRGFVEPMESSPSGTVTVRDFGCRGLSTSRQSGNFMIHMRFCCPLDVEN